MGSTFEDNARLKAQAFARASGLLTLADDSGLEVDALGGEPGAMSARYAGKNATDAERVRYLLAKLEGIPMDKRAARFCCVIAIASTDGRVENLFRRMHWRHCPGAMWRAQVSATTLSFFCRGLGKTMAELTAEVKNRIGRHDRAAAKARLILKRIDSERA